MTNQYKHFANLNIEQIEPMKVTDIEKARMKQHVTGKNKIKSKRIFWRTIVAAAIIATGSLGALGYTFPGFAAQIPFMQGVLSYFDKENGNFYAQYEKNATPIGQTQSSNGITMMIENAIYDGTTVTIAFGLETEKNLGENPGFAQDIIVKNEIGEAGTSKIEKISNTRYAGILRITPTFKKQQDIIKVDWSPKSFTNYQSSESIAGDWNFNFELIKLNGKVQLVDKSVANKDVKLIINEIRSTKVSNIIDYQQIVQPSLLKKWKDVSPILQIKDDLGNEYHVESNGGMSDNSLNFKWSDTIGMIDKKATKLYIQPTMIYSLGEGKGHKEQRMETIEINLH